MDSRPPAEPDLSGWRPFLSLLLPGLIGVIALAPMLAEMLAGRARDAELETDVPIALLTALSLIQPALLVALGVWAGLRLAPRVGLRSHLVHATRGGPSPLVALQPELGSAVALGAGVAALILGLDLLAQPWVQPDAEAQIAPRTLAVTLAGLLYGGISEELMVRWGLMTFLVWAAWRVTQGGRGEPETGVYWVALLSTAVAFGAGHLPGAAAAGLSLTPAFALRTIVLNALAGGVYGWLYWRRSLEAAMVAHAATHVVFTLAAWVVPGVEW